MHLMEMFLFSIWLFISIQELVFYVPQQPSIQMSTIDTRYMAYAIILQRGMTSKIRYIYILHTILHT